MHDIEALIFDGFFDIGKCHGTFVEYDGERFGREIDNGFRHAAELAHGTFDSLLAMTAMHTLYDDNLFQKASLLPECSNCLILRAGKKILSKSVFSPKTACIRYCFGYFAVMAFQISGCSCPSRHSAMPAGLYFAMTSIFAFILRSSSNHTS